jgi:CubicO group peptidase (beta-lactamase class C family)
MRNRLTITKSTTALATSALLVLGLAACGGSGDDASTDSETTASEETTPAEDEASDTTESEDATEEESGDAEAQTDEDVPTYPLPGLIYKPGTDSCYSNHAFGLVGHIIDEQAGALTYPQLVTQTVLQPLGLTDVVVNNTAISELDAWPYGSALDETDVSDSPATGGWSATARDMVRIMCALDGASNNLRLLQPQTVATMESVAYPQAGSAPLGWDARYDFAVTKNGSIGGGRSQITKYLPGRFDTAEDDEINVAVNVNSSAASPTIELLRSIAATVAAADIPEDYDLFDPAYACVVPPETPQEPGLAVPQLTLTATPAPPPLAVPTAPSPPTVTIRQPGSGQHIAPNGVASIAFSGLGRSADGTSIPGTHYRWTLTQAGTRTVACTGSEFDTGASPPSVGGIAAVVDCTSFARTLHNPFPGAGPPITIRLEAQDPNGTSADTSVVISLVTPPVG